MSVLAFFGKHLCERGHDIKVQSIDLVVEPLCVERSLGTENRHGMIDVFFFLRSNGGEGLAKASRRNLTHPRIAGDGERFQHDFLHDQAANEVALRDAAQEGFAQPLPMQSIDVTRYVNSNLAPFRSEASAMAALNLRVFQSIRHFFGIGAYLR